LIKKSQLIASFNGITDLILIIDLDYNIVFANSAFCDFYGIKDSREIIGRKCYSTCHEMLERCDFCPARKTMKSGEIVTIEKTLRGEILKYWTYPVYSGNNVIENIVSYSRIITVQKKMEWELVRSEKLKGIGQLAAGAAHEINNPLCSILGFSELIQESISKTDKSYKFLNDIIESTLQAKRIVDGLLEYSRQTISRTRYFSISEIITKTIDLTKYQQRIKNISVKLKKGNNLPKVKIDMQKTVQAFLNIILNGIDASGVGGTIFISAQWHGKDYVSVKFQDCGCGIPQENISNIFDPFFTTKDVGKGTGLGLSIAQSIIEQQNGKIRVESELGKGSTFEVLFPVKD